MTFEHETVLLKETIDGLAVKPDGIYVDCTLGGAGHAKYLLTKLGPNGRLFAFDQDQMALDNARKILADDIEAGRVILIHQNFRHLSQALQAQGLTSVDGIYFDLGVSSPQLDQAQRGFSYHAPARLDMRMDQRQALSAYEIVNTWSFEDLTQLIFRYGEEKFAKRIARAIEQSRKIRPIELTTDLAELVKQAIPAATRRTGGHPAKRTFQAIRIAVNDELGAVEDALSQALDFIHPKGRVAVITFHSLEDRLVKQMFKELVTPHELPRNLPVLPSQQLPAYQLVNRKPIEATQAELNVNNRARSARLRIIERTRIN